ncbi:MAG: YciI family protein [Thaumarchaeota archaeon]|nr:YciI family protein [Nitrososphaerota archaeon]MDG6905890.1 hypothetical protein [Nitrososphaerota archaeon]
MIVAQVWTNRVKNTHESGTRRKAWLREMGSKGKIIMAGRYPDYSGGINVWKVDNLQEAEAIVADDPSVKEGLIDYFLKEWMVGFNYTVNPPRVVS